MTPARSPAELAADYAAFSAEGRAALLAGHATHDVPFTEGAPRWGMTSILRMRIHRGSRVQLNPLETVTVGA
ncbi:hypothetical protein [Nonomuraea typhae]|uniref:hypothetical protein n=1 Tax=Nonomuraea typhae TaxID=2603600 RepID=UPI0012FB738F|nr:hypothetical protein [Nonomuraea typhae]